MVPVGGVPLSAGEKEKEFKVVSMSMQRPGEAGHFGEMCGWSHGLEHRAWLLRGTRWEGAGAEEGSGPQTSSEERQEASEVIKQGITSQAFYQEAALWLLPGERRAACRLVIVSTGSGPGEVRRPHLALGFMEGVKAGWNSKSFLV